MNSNIALELLKLKGNHGSEEASEIVISDPLLLPSIFDAVYSTSKGVKNSSIKTISIISEKKPQLIYDEFNFIQNLLDSKDNILKWNATIIIGNLVEADIHDNINKVIDKLIKQLFDETLITAANTVGSIWKIAYCKPHLEKEITKNLLNIDCINRNEECQRILAGKTILAFGNYFEKITDKAGVIKYARLHLKSKRNATAKKAEKFIRKWG
ncbi:MAG: hypothetical protein HOF35_06335 [Bacteroidetes bacterium]|nr:hypothetical protein [Bacteroidota bacterium]